MRPIALAVAAGSVLTLAVESAGAEPRSDAPQCPRASKKPTVLFTGTGPDGQAPLYMRACGPARATVVLQGRSYRVSGGYCRLARTRNESGDVTWTAHGEANLRPRLAGGSFSLVSHGDRAQSGIAIAGSWTCR